MSIIFVEKSRRLRAAAICLLLFATPGAMQADSNGNRRRTLNEILNLQRGQTGDMELYFWKAHPAVGVMSFRTATVQGMTLNRIAAYAEKKGVRGRILTDAQLRAYMKKTGSSTANFYAAHDYRGSQLARFFNLAYARRVRLNAHEKRLEKTLMRNRIIRLRRKSSRLPSYRSGGRVLISLPADFSRRTRGVLLRHEARHALFFTNRRYRAACRRFWKREVATVHRKFFRRLFAFMDYDPGDEYLMINEFQSYVLQEAQPFERYLRWRARKRGGEFIADWMRRYPGRIASFRAQLKRELRAWPLR